MGELDSITNIDVYKAMMATVIMAVAGVGIFFRRRWIERKQNTEDQA